MGYNTIQIGSQTIPIETSFFGSAYEKFVCFRSFVIKFSNENFNSNHDVAMIMLSTVYRFIKLETLGGNEACNRSGGDLAIAIKLMSLASLSKTDWARKVRKL